MHHKGSLCVCLEQAHAVRGSITHMDAEGETAFRRQLQLPDERLLLYRFVGIFIMVVKPDLSDDIDLVCSAQRFQAVPVLFLQIIGVAGIESIGDMDEGMLAFERIARSYSSY